MTQIQSIKLSSLEPTLIGGGGTAYKSKGVAPFSI